MLYNISNHPSSQWSDEQVAEAVERFGDIVDYPFPAVPPDASTGEVISLANEIADDVKARGGFCVAMVQGEFTLTYHLVNELQARYIPCVVATSQRNPATIVDGKVVSGFSFVSFRFYTE